MTTTEGPLDQPEAESHFGYAKLALLLYLSSFAGGIQELPGKSRYCALPLR